MFTMVGWGESVDQGAAFGSINAIPDQHVFTDGDNIRVPEQMPFLIGAAMLTAATTLTAARLVAPSLRSVINVDLEPLVNAAVFGSPPEGSYWPDAPTPLDPFEGLQLETNTDNAGAVEIRGLALFADGPQRPVSGRMYTIRATAAVALATNTWVNGALTFIQTLPVGRYQVVGMRARGTNLIATRLVFVGGLSRPGVLAVNAIGDTDPYWVRYGRMGVFGEFHTNTPPTVDCLGITDTAQTILLDLIRVG